MEILMSKRITAATVICLVVIVGAWYFYSALEWLHVPVPIGSVAYGLIALGIWNRPALSQSATARRLISISAVVGAIASFTAAMLWAGAPPSEIAGQVPQHVDFAIAIATITGVLFLCIVVISLALTVRLPAPSQDSALRAANQ